MTWREKISKEDPERVDEGLFGGMVGCPPNKSDYCDEECPNNQICTKCWTREVPEDDIAEVPDLSKIPVEVINNEVLIDSVIVTADDIANMYHRLLDRGLRDTTVERIVLQLVDNGYFDKRGN